MRKVASGFSPIIAIDRKSLKPLHRQVYEGFRLAILGHNLRAGQKLPSTRSLAMELRVSRIPVLTAYAQLLAEGYFESRTGSGTSVSQIPCARFTPLTRSHSTDITRICDCAMRDAR